SVSINETVVEEKETTAEIVEALNV
ncbi:50S ribosomal protein L17, partial [termite gut metagenome]